MSVRYGFTVEIYGFGHSLRAAHDAIAMAIEVEDSEDRRRHQNESRCTCMETVNCSTKG